MKFTIMNFGDNVDKDKNKIRHTPSCKLTT